MTDTDTRAEFAAVAAGSADTQVNDESDSEGKLSTPSTTSTTSRPTWPSLTNCWRGLFTLSLGLTLCALAVAESTGEANAPAWFLGFAIPVLTEWVGEWVVWGRTKGTA